VASLAGAPAVEATSATTTAAAASAGAVRAVHPCSTRPRRMGCSMRKYDAMATPSAVA
jgi:hypothetical protein